MIDIVGLDDSRGQIPVAGVNFGKTSVGPSVTALWPPIEKSFCQEAFCLKTGGV